VVEFTGTIQGGWFFEANILVNVLNADKNVLVNSYGIATDDWMTTEPVEFTGEFDLTGVPIGPAYIEIRNDNASGLPEYDINILIPIMIE